MDFGSDFFEQVIEFLVMLSVVILSAIGVSEGEIEDFVEGFYDEIGIEEAVELDTTFEVEREAATLVINIPNDYVTYVDDFNGVFIGTSDFAVGEMLETVNDDGPSLPIGESVILFEVIGISDLNNSEIDMAAVDLLNTVAENIEFGGAVSSAEIVTLADAPDGARLGIASSEFVGELYVLRYDALVFVAIAGSGGDDYDPALTEAIISTLRVLPNE